MTVPPLMARLALLLMEPDLPEPYWKVAPVSTGDRRRRSPFCPRSRNRPTCRGGHLHQAGINIGRAGAEGGGCRSRRLVKPENPREIGGDRGIAAGVDKA